MSCQLLGAEYSVSLLPFFDLTVDIGQSLTIVAWAMWDLTPIWSALTGGSGAIC